MAWPKGKPHGGTKAASIPATCAECGETKTLKQFPYKHWKKGWKQLKQADPEKYQRRCKACVYAKNAVKADKDFEADRGAMPAHPSLRRGPKRKTKPKIVNQHDKRAWQSQYKRKIRRKSRIQCLRYLAKKGCSDCGERDPRVLEFDHIEPSNKKSAIATMMSQGYLWSNPKLRREIRKCRVLCANCHRLHTAIQQGYYSHDDVQAELQSILRTYGINDSSGDAKDS